MLRHERLAWKSGYSRLAGIDEAGRGPLAGPVIAAAVYIKRSFLEAQRTRLLKGLNDSKQLTHEQREHFFGVLTSHPETIRYGVAGAEVDEIDTINILRATHVAMSRALLPLVEEVDHLLIDGLPVPGLPRPSTAIVEGDGKSLLIAAASVIAKVTRDRMMVELDRQYPAYGFARHKGYGTPEHLQALRAHGTCPCHRISFRPCAETWLDLGD